MIVEVVVASNEPSVLVVDDSWQVGHKGLHWIAT
jgi:hypothetical protein